MSANSVTEWRRPIGCLKMQVIFGKRATNCRTLLRKMTYKDQASCGSAPRCKVPVCSYQHKTGLCSCEDRVVKSRCRQRVLRHVTTCYNMLLRYRQNVGKGLSNAKRALYNATNSPACVLHTVFRKRTET